MKKSFLTRIMAAALSVPVALTQTAAFGTFAADGDEKGSVIDLNSLLDVEAVVEDIAVSDITIPAGLQEEVAGAGKLYDTVYAQKGAWNEKLANALAGMDDTTIDLDKTSLVDTLAASKSWYADALCEMLKDDSSKAVANVTSDKITININVTGYDYAATAVKRVQSKLEAEYEDVAKRFNADNIKTSLDADVTLTIDTEGLAGDTTVPFTATIELDGKEVTTEEALFDYADKKIAETKEGVLGEVNRLKAEYEIERNTAYGKLDDAKVQLGDAEDTLETKKGDLAKAQAQLEDIPDKTSKEYADALADVTAAEGELANAERELAKAKQQLADAEQQLADADAMVKEAEKLAATEIDNAIKAYTDKLDRAKEKAEILDSTVNKSYEVDSMDELLTALDKGLTKRSATLGGFFPSTVDTAVNSAAGKLVDNVIKQLSNGIENYTIDITAANIGDVAKQMKYITADINTGDRKGIATVDGFVADDLSDTDKATYLAYFEDQLGAKLEEQGLEIVDVATYKYIKAEGAAQVSGLAGTADLDVERVIWVVVEDVETTESTEPTETTEETEPSDTTEETEPSDTTEETEPSDTTEETEPSDTTEETEPSDTTEETEPSDTTEETEPSDTTEETEPSDTTEETEPSDTTEETEPSDTTEDTEPSDTTEDTEPSDTTEDTEPSDTTEDTEPSDTTEDTEPSDTTEPEYGVVKAENITLNVNTDTAFYFSHDTNAFDPADLIKSATAVVNTENGEETVNVDVTKFTFGIGNTSDATLNPAGVFNKKNAYTATTLNVFYEGVLVTSNKVDVYIGVKGDANLDGLANATDAALVLQYAAEYGANGKASIAEDADLENFVYFLADVDAESKTHAVELNASDAAAILRYAAIYGANGKCDWIPEVLSAPYPEYSEKIAKKAGLIK